MSKSKNKGVNKLKKIFAEGGEVEEDDSLLGNDFLDLYGENPINQVYPDQSAMFSNSDNSISNTIAGKESGGNYGAVSPNSSAVGKYQFLWNTHKNDIKKITGVSSKEEFRNNPQAQEAYFAYYSENTLLPEAKKLYPKMKEDFPDLTLDDVEQAVHFAGSGNLRKAIKNKNYSQPLDANGTSILSYMGKKKYAGGGNVGQWINGGMDVLNGVLGIVNTFNNDPNAYSNQPVVTARQTAAFNPYSKDFGNTNLPKFAKGGKVKRLNYQQASDYQRQGLPYSLDEETLGQPNNNQYYPNTRMPLPDAGNYNNPSYIFGWNDNIPELSPDNNMQVPQQNTTSGQKQSPYTLEVRGFVYDDKGRKTFGTDGQLATKVIGTKVFNNVQDMQKWIKSTGQLKNNGGVGYNQSYTYTGKDMNKFAPGTFDDSIAPTHTAMNTDILNQTIGNTQEGDQFAMGGGIHIKKANKGKFTASANRAGMGVQEFAAHILANKSKYSPTLVKRANFARNASKWHHAMGGYADMYAMGGVPIEAEGNELVQTPNGSLGQLQGPSHEQGGIDMNVPEGTKIYSDRLKIDNKSMADRKKYREKTLDRLQKLLDKNPKDNLLQSSIARTQKVLALEEAKDMAIQESANNIMNSTGNKFALGGDVPDYYDPELSPYTNDLVSFNPDLSAGVKINSGNSNSNPIAPATSDSDLGITGTPMQMSASAQNQYNDTGLGMTLNPRNSASLDSALYDDTESKSGNGYDMGLTTGDLFGLAGNAFNAIAPLINTEQNRAGNRPNQNFYQNFGEDALKANDQAKTYVAGQREHALTELRQQLNAAKANNRNSARSVNTIRALDSATNLSYGNGLNSIYDAFSKQMMGLLGQESTLDNQRDLYQMQGEQQRDLADRQDRDNYYSNRGQDLTNLGNNITGIGQNLNTSHGNKVGLNLLRQLSKYGLSFDSNGNLVKTQ